MAGCVHPSNLPPEVNSGLSSLIRNFNTKHTSTIPLRIRTVLSLQAPKILHTPIHITKIAFLRLTLAILLELTPPARTPTTPALTILRVQFSQAPTSTFTISVLHSTTPSHLRLTFLTFRTLPSSLGSVLSRSTKSVPMRHIKSL